MEKIIKGEEVFQWICSNMAISPSNEGYTLMYGVNPDGMNQYGESIEPSVNLIVSDIPRGLYFQLVGNRTEVKVIG